MTGDAIFCCPGDSLSHAAELVRRCGGGPVPVVRDRSSRSFIAVIEEGRWMRTARQRTDLRVRDVMVLPPLICHAGEDASQMLQAMERLGVPRAVVLHPDGTLAGMAVHPRLARRRTGAGALLWSAAAFALGAIVMLVFQPGPQRTVSSDSGQPRVPPGNMQKPARRRSSLRQGARRTDVRLTATALGGGLAMYAVKGRGPLAKATAMLGMGMLARGLSHWKGDDR